MSALISYFSDYARKIWIKYRNRVTSRVSSSASVVVRESEYYCAVQYNTPLARESNFPRFLSFGILAVKTIHLDFNGQNMFSNVGKVV